MATDPNPYESTSARAEQLDPGAQIPRLRSIRRLAIAVSLALPVLGLLGTMVFVALTFRAIGDAPVSTLSKVTRTAMLLSTAALIPLMISALFVAASAGRKARALEDAARKHLLRGIAADE